MYLNVLADSELYICKDDDVISALERRGRALSSWFGVSDVSICSVQHGGLHR